MLVGRRTVNRSNLFIPVTDGFSGAEIALSLSQSKAEYVRHIYSYGFRVLTRLSGKGDVLCVLKTHTSWVYHEYMTSITQTGW